MGSDQLGLREIRKNISFGNEGFWISWAPIFGPSFTWWCKNKSADRACVCGLIA